MLGRTRGGGTSSSSRARAEGGGVSNVVGGRTTIATDGGQEEVTVSQFVAQLDEAARLRLDSMHQRLRLLEQQMETLEAEVGKASGSSLGARPIDPSGRACPSLDSYRRGYES